MVRGTLPDALIPVETFRLDTQCTSKPSSFSFELLIDETIYEFSFTLTRKAILEEKLKAGNIPSKSRRNRGQIRVTTGVIPFCNQDDYNVSSFCANYCS